MRRLAHLSDLHFGRSDPALVAALAADLAAMAPDLVVISGDLTQRARRSEFTAARDFVVSLGRPVVATPGNHDLIALNPLMRLIAPLHRYDRYIRPHTLSAFFDDELAVVTVDSTARVRFSLDWSGGRMRMPDVVAAGSRLNEVPRLEVIVTHHALQEITPAGGPADRLRRRALQRAGDLGFDMVLGGHHHRPDMRAVALRGGSPGRNILVGHAATSTSRRVRGHPNGYNLFTVSTAEVCCAVRVAAEHGFTEARALKFRKEQGVWREISGTRVATRSGNG
jgi:3',5'-cyclic AMP phosphodiesterase CpdA